MLTGFARAFAWALGECGAVPVVSGHICGKTNAIPLHVEILYNKYNFVAAFAVALVTITVKAMLGRKFGLHGEQAM